MNSCLSAAVCAVLASFAWTSEAASGVKAPKTQAQSSIQVRIDATQMGKRIPNTSQVLTVWNGATADWSLPDNPLYPTRDFVEYVELMACTGGNASRDLFKNPTDRTVLDDYDFEPLLRACRGILARGAKPYLKLGNVPVKYSRDYDGGEFSMNIRPPDDHLVHYRYMKACAEALKSTFGREEVRRWRFAVLTEADNIGWFRAKSGDKAEIREEFFKLYDYTAKAFEDVLGPDLAFGTHLLYPGDANISQFSVADVVAHCSTGTNSATGGRGAPLRLLTLSYYAWPNNDSLEPGRMKYLSGALTTARQAGFTNLVTGIDEGRLIVASPGRDKSDLLTRAVGASYEAAFDVRIVRSLLDAGADYCATWGWFSGPKSSCQGVPSHHYFTCREFARFAGLKRVPVETGGEMPEHEELDVIAGVSEDVHTIRFVVGRFRDKLVFTNRLAASVQVKLPPALAERTVSIETLTLDDRTNWYCDWERDRVNYGIKTEDYSWSPDDFAILGSRTLVSKEMRDLFATRLQPVYASRAATVRPVLRRTTVDAAGTVAIPVDFVGNGASFVLIKVTSKGE